jgi:ATP diphosphatase
MRKLRDPESGCPWDKKQNFTSIAPYTIEEAYEVSDAIERGDMDDLRDELGDLLLQVIFHAQMAEEEQLFDFSDVVAALSDKLIRRHPHVFADKVINEQALHLAWEQQKALELKQKKQQESKGTSALDGVTRALPALMRAQKLQKKAALVGFDWNDAGPVFDKIEEELNEVREAVKDQSFVEQEEELGDLLFAVVNLTRHLGVDAETALRRGNEKFSRRFKSIEKHLSQRQQCVEETPLQELELLWQQVKAAEKAI